MSLTSLKSVGDPDTDRTHALLLSKMESIVDYIKTKNLEFAKDRLKELYNMAESHFMDEEELMKKLNYPFSNIHILAHKTVLAKIKTLSSTLNKSNVEALTFLITSLVKVLEDHVEHYDISLFYYNEHFANIKNDN